MAFVLDTHIWIWFLEGDERIREPERVIIARERDVRISAMSVWEVADLSGRGRLELAMACERWVGAALSHRGIAIEPLSPEIAIATTRLPGEIHRDPMDRIIVATARALGATLVTRDRRLVAYGRAGHVNVLEA
jgi:PIN domain nuclease of toxin-antitoxin system